MRTGRRRMPHSTVPISYLRTRVCIFSVRTKGHLFWAIPLGRKALVIVSKNLSFTLVHPVMSLFAFMKKLAVNWNTELNLLWNVWFLFWHTHTRKTLALQHIGTIFSQRQHKSDVSQLETCFEQFYENVFIYVHCTENGKTNEYLSWGSLTGASVQTGDSASWFCLCPCQGKTRTKKQSLDWPQVK